MHDTYTAAQVAAQLGGYREGRYKWRCACPCCGGHNLTVGPGDTLPVLFWCHNGCDWRDVVDALHDLGVDTEDDDADTVFDSTTMAISRAEERERKTAAAAAIYAQSLPAAGTPVEAYLRGRGITIPVPPVLRFNPKAPHRLGWERFPAMIAPVMRVDGQLVAVHLTYLKPDGSGKWPFPDKRLQRECRGPVSGGAVRLADMSRSVTVCHGPLIIAEGIETALSCTQLFDLPAWSALSASGLMALELPAEIKTVTIAVDNDVHGVGQEAAWQAYLRWYAEGRKVRKIKPHEVGADFNDVLIAEGRRDG